MAPSLTASERDGSAARAPRARATLDSSTPRVDKSRTLMDVFDRVLGYAEFGLVPISIVWLLLACWRPNRRRVRRATALAFVLAATVAQPFGVVASEQEAAPGRGPADKH